MVDAGLDGVEVGQGATEPPYVDVVHSAAAGCSLDYVLGLFLGTDEEDFATFKDDGADEVAGIVEHGDSLLKVDDVDAVALGEDVALHLGVPTAGLMAEMHA